MPETNISNAAYGDKLNQQTDYSVDAVSTDGPGDQKETTWVNPRWAIQLGYYKQIPELKAAIDAKARWTIGKGFTSPSELTEMVLGTIKGTGKETFNSILENQIRVSEIGGDSFAEIIRNKEGYLINIKPLDPSTIEIVANRAGLIIRYNQIGKIKGLKKTFTPDKIFHLSRDRVADEIHGVSVVDAVEENILMRNEAMADYKTALHRNIYPVRIYYLDTDNETKIAAFKAKADRAGYQGENIYIPMGAVTTELAGTPPNSTLNPMPWIAMLTQKFYQEVGVPQIIVGGSAEFTEATAKIVFLAFEATIEEKQLALKEQVLAQLNLEINFELAASLQQGMLSDMGKEESLQAATPEDTSVTNTGLESQVTPETKGGAA